MYDTEHCRAVNWFAMSIFNGWLPITRLAWLVSPAHFKRDTFNKPIFENSLTDMNTKISLATILVTTAFLGACGQKNSDPAQDTAAASAPAPISSAIIIPKSTVHVDSTASVAAQIVADTTAAASSASAKETAADAGLPHADTSTPLDRYQPLTDAGQQLTLYYALSSEAVDYDKVAQAESPEYRDTTDVFKRKALLDQIKPKIDAQIAAFKKNPYVVIHWDNGRLGHYEVTGQFFPVNNFPLSRDVTSWVDSPASDHPYTITNGDTFKKFAVADQTKAQQIEATLASNSLDETKADAYLFGQGVDQATHQIKLQLVELNLTDSKGLPVGVVK